VQVMKETIKMTGPNFSARRMAKEYTEKFYRKAIDASLKAGYRTAKVGPKEDLFRRI